MDKSLSQSLHGLIPTLPAPLPATLLDLSTSLLAQSRIQARSLKADEEIARAYACAHLACERLKVSLALPKIQPRPPCPPRTYQKLYRYLDGALSTASPRRSTRFHDDSRNKKDDAPSTPSRSAGLKPGTPTQQKNSEEKSLGKLKRPSVRRAAAVSAAGNRNEKQGKEEDLVPQWVMPAIRVLCKKLGASAAPPHIYTGVSSILTLAAPISRTYRTAEGGDHEGKSSSQQQARALGKSSAKIPALIVAVGLIVFTCLSGKSTPPAEYARQKILGLDSLKGYFSQSVPAPGGAGREELLKTVGDGDGLSFDNPADVDEWLREIRDRGWTRLDWFKNVGQGTGLTVGDGGEDENGDQDKDEEGAHSVGDEENEEEDSWTVRRGFEEGVEEGEYLQAGLGTMMQDKLDYLSEGRRRDYQRWKRGMIVRIEEMAKEREMDVSNG